MIKGWVTIYTNLTTQQRSVLPTPKAMLEPTKSYSTYCSIQCLAEVSPTTTTTGGEWTSAREARGLSASGSSGKTAKVSGVPSP